MHDQQHDRMTAAQVQSQGSVKDGLWCKASSPCKHEPCLVSMLRSIKKPSRIVVQFESVICHTAGPVDLSCQVSHLVQDPQPNHSKHLLAQRPDAEHQFLCAKLNLRGLFPSFLSRPDAHHRAQRAWCHMCGEAHTHAMKITRLFQADRASQPAHAGNTWPSCTYNRLMHNS